MPTFTEVGLRLPDFIGVGPPRTATTWLHEALSGHVGLPAGIKETDFFVYQYDRGLAWYASHFRDCPPDRPAGEFSANYFIGAKTRERIAHHIPECKIICTLRDPVERVYSHYRKMREGAYFCGTFEECLEKRSDVLEWSKYAYHVAEWRNLFGTENVLVMIQDDLKTDAQSFIDRACDFLGIARIPLKPGSQSKLVNAIPAQPWNSWVARMARKTRDKLQQRGHYRVVELLKRTGLRDVIFASGPAFEPISSEVDARLRAFFRPQIESLEEMLGRDLSKWKIGKTSGK